MSSTLRSTARACARRWLCAALLSVVSLVVFEAPSWATRRMPDDDAGGPCNTGDCHPGLKQQPVRGPARGPSRPPGGRGRLPDDIVIDLLKARLIHRF